MILLFPSSASRKGKDKRGQLEALFSLISLYNIIFTQQINSRHWTQMYLKPCLALLLLALASVMLAEASSSDKVHELSFNDDGAVGDFIGDDNELLLDSETNRRTLLAGRQRYISYGALRANQVPCGQRGRSYYNCQRRGRANPYRRGCSAITHCARNVY